MGARQGRAKIPEASSAVPDHMRNRTNDEKVYIRNKDDRVWIALIEGVQNAMKDSVSKSPSDLSTTGVLQVNLEGPSRTLFNIVSRWNRMEIKFISGFPDLNPHAGRD